MAALAGLSCVLAHGGTAGAIVELVVVVTLTVVVLAAWLAGRRAAREREER